MRKRFLFTILTFATFGCVSVTTDPFSDVHNDPYAPSNSELLRGYGVVQYLNNGANFVLEDRRRKAYKAAYKSCAGPYTLVDENEARGNAHTTVVTNTNNGAIANSFSSDWKRLYYKCNEEKTSEQIKAFAEKLKEEECTNYNGATKPVGCD